MQLLLGIIFVFITGPLSSHMIMKAAYNIKTPYTKNTKIDEINDDLKDKNYNGAELRIHNEFCSVPLCCIYCVKHAIINRNYYVL